MRQQIRFTLVRVDSKKGRLTQSGELPCKGPAAATGDVASRGSGESNPGEGCRSTSATQRDDLDGELEKCIWTASWFGSDGHLKTNKPHILVKKDWTPADGGVQSSDQLWED